ncbi:uncharacterized protein LOC143858592 [Tasmannia lanceolata]|uniref:uncharacterized protein LOC143858592 n=1 Tax=Tasmannia lanceolata TaxID=3420 RepID=UPI0040630E13
MVENFDIQYLQTEACKSMLLRPRSAYEIECMELPIQLKDTKVTNYTCPDWSFGTRSHNLLSMVSNARCRCGQVMDRKMSPIVDVKGMEGVFVEGIERFMISDDLFIRSVSTERSLVLIQSLGITDMTVLEEINLNVGEDKVLDLLKCLLVSKTPLSDVFLSKRETTDAVKVMKRHIMSSPLGSGNKKMRVRLLLSKSNGKVLYAEAGEDFIDLLFSFLTLPAGSVVKFLGTCSSLGCVDNLYMSIQDLIADGLIHCDLTPELTNPKLASHFVCENNLLQIEEAAPLNPAYEGSILQTMNPKSPNGITESGGGFVKGPATFMLTDDLDVKPFSLSATISLLKKLNLPLSDFEVQVVSVGEER